MKTILTYLLLLSLLAVKGQLPSQGIADSLYAVGNYTMAINTYAKDGSTNSLLQIARAYNAMGNYEKSVLQYENLTANAPELQIAQFELGKLYFKIKRFDACRKLFSTLLSSTENNAEYHYYLAESFRMLEQEGSSLVHYKSAITIDSTHLKSLFRLGKYFLVKQQPREALEYINKGLRFYKNDVSLINLKALALFNNDEYGKALPSFERLLELGERKPHVYAKLAYCYFQEWELEKAKDTYHKLIKMDDTDPDSYFNLGHVFLKNKKVDSATFYIKKSIEVQTPSFHREYRSLANIERENGDLKEALKYYKLAHKEEPQDYMTYYQVCALADQLYKDPKQKLEYYQNFISKYRSSHPYFLERVNKRISELKEEIHFAGN